jgi:hypothetical protein
VDAGRSRLKDAPASLQIEVLRSLTKMPRTMKVPGAISAILLIGALALCGPALAQTSSDSAKRAGAEKARSEQLQAISRAVSEWDQSIVGRLDWMRSLLGCGSNCPANRSLQLEELEKSLDRLVEGLVNEIRAIPVVACDAAFAERVKHMFDDKASDRKPLQVKVEPKCQSDGKFLLSTVTTFDIKSVQSDPNNEPAKRAGAERAKSEQMQAIARAVREWDQGNVAGLAKLKALAGCESNCPPKSGDELLVLDGNLHDSVARLLNRLGSIPVAGCDTAFAQGVKHLFDDKASDRKPLAVKVESTCASDGKLRLSTVTSVDTKRIQTTTRETMP